MHSFRPPTEEELQHRERAERRREQALVLALSEKNRARYQQDLEKNELILGNLLEFLLEAHPKLGAPFKVQAGASDKYDKFKEELIKSAAQQLMNNHGPIQQNDLNNTLYLDQLVIHLVKTMVMNHFLAYDPTFQKVLAEQRKLVITFAEKISEQPDLSFAEKDSLHGFGNTVKENKPPKEITDLLNDMEEEVLKKMQGPLAELSKKTEELTKNYLDQRGEALEKEIATTLREHFSPSQLKPALSAKRGDNKEAETAELRENPYANLTGLNTNQQGSIPITISSNIGNGLGLINNLRASLEGSRENVDSGHTQATMQAGAITGAHLGFDNASTAAFQQRVTLALQNANPQKSSLPNPLNTEEKPL